MEAYPTDATADHAGVLDAIRSRRQPVDDRIKASLEYAAAIWFDEYRDQFPDGHYSTVANLFLHAAEHAYFDAQAEWTAIEAQRAYVNDELRGSEQEPSTGFFVYRLRDDDDRLIYVGSTRKIQRRLARHRAVMGDLWTTVTWEQFDTATEMLDAERAAIATEFPAMNVAGV